MSKSSLKVRDDEVFCLFSSHLISEMASWAHLEGQFIRGSYCVNLNRGEGWLEKGDKKTMGSTKPKNHLVGPDQNSSFSILNPIKADQMLPRSSQKGNQSNHLPPLLSSTKRHSVACCLSIWKCQLTFMANRVSCSKYSYLEHSVPLGSCVFIKYAT